MLLRPPSSPAGRYAPGGYGAATERWHMPGLGGCSRGLFSPSRRLPRWKEQLGFHARAETPSSRRKAGNRGILLTIHGGLVGERGEMPLICVLAGMTL